MMPDTPRRRRSDLKGWRRFAPSRRAFYESSIMVLLAVIVVTTLSTNSRADKATTNSGRAVCALEDVGRALNESVELARAQAPVIEAARRLVTAKTPEDYAAAEEALRRVAPMAPAEVPDGPVVIDVGDVVCSDADDQSMPASPPGTAYARRP